MSDIIQLLSDSVANQIAAGEVIQRPASVVKEMMENSVDAGAKNIDVIIVDAGRTLIQIVDDGKGMSETDARLSFERHATSKIRKADDLFSLHTMGFRGEALPSIAAVSRIELKTRQPEDEIGTSLSLTASKFIGQEPCSCFVGCNFKVENLFFNVPARRKFLKANSTELNNIITAFERIVLVNPGVAFKLISNGAELFNLRATALRQRIVDIFGKHINQFLLPVNTDTSMCRISGFVGKPESARKKVAQQFFFVNGRFMRHPYFHKALMSAFDRLIPNGEQVPYFIYFDVPPENIDVNIHPTKTEIKFENEQAIWQILMAVVKEAVGLFSDVPSIDFSSTDSPEIPVYNPNEKTKAPKIDINTNYNPFESVEHKAPAFPAGLEKLYSGIKPAADDEDLFSATLPSKVGGSIEGNISDEKSPAHYQYKGRFIITAVKSGLMFIEQHRAHVRIVYEKYMNYIKQKKAVSQKTLFPERVEIPPADANVFTSLLPELEATGFEISDLGGGSYAINAMPDGLEGISCTTLINEMISAAQEVGTSTIDDINHAVALSLARSAAIPIGQVLSNEEMENVVNELFACSNVKYAPDGKPIIGILSQQEIDRLF